MRLAARMARHRRGWQVVLALSGLLGLASLGGCGISLDAQPIPIEGHNLGALAANQNVTPAAAAPEQGSHSCDTRKCAVSIYFFKYGVNYSVDLEPVTRIFDKKKTPTLQAELQFALAELGGGPTTAEAGSGYFSWLPPNPTLTIGKLSTLGELTITLDPATTLLGLVPYEYALAEIVWTMTQFTPAVKSVLFQYAGANYPALLPDGVWTPAAVTRQQYSSLGPQSAASAHA